MFVNPFVKNNNWVKENKAAFALLDVFVVFAVAFAFKNLLYFYIEHKQFA